MSESLQDGTEPKAKEFFSSALRKFKSPILGWEEARAFCFFFLKRKWALSQYIYNVETLIKNYELLS